MTAAREGYDLAKRALEAVVDLRESVMGEQAVCLITHLCNQL